LPNVAANRDHEVDAPATGQEILAMMPTTLTEAHTTIDHAVRPGGLYCVREAAMMVGLNPETVRRRIRRGEIRAWGRPQRISLDDLLPIYVPDSCRK
jgi:hypothetical protein